jgi:hypothetical protein
MNLLFIRTILDAVDVNNNMFCDAFRQTGTRFVASNVQ